jgi:SAM-dependent methyltransferase
MRQDLHEINRLAWNEATKAHNSHKADQARFLRDGGSTLFAEEIELLGDLNGMELLHLQCNAGQDTLSLAQCGAIATGVDISDEAIAFAKQLAVEAGIAATFERADVFDWLAEAANREQRFDLAFSSYGAIIWLSDLTNWAKGIANVLRPGGRFVLVDFHPCVDMINEQWQLSYSYGGHLQSFAEGIGDYVAMTGPALAPSGYLDGVQLFRNPHPSHEFNWGIGEVVTALIDAGLILEVLREYPYANGFRPFDGMQELAGGRFTAPAGKPSIPLMYALRVRKRGEQ